LKCAALAVKLDYRQSRWEALGDSSELGKGVTVAAEISEEIGCGTSYVIASADNDPFRVTVLVKADEESDCTVTLHRGDVDDPKSWRRVRNGELQPGQGSLFHVKLKANSDLIVHCSQPDPEVPEPTCSFSASFSL
jgi:hypothetical protein